ncbi:SDR family oxidoreductase [Gammaproteobacteria bacterium]|nr:SDR family oxidoreductase [Gammaproteobacteria bacterium]
MSFEAKVAFVAGAGGGMGLNIAGDLISKGAHVALADIKPRPEDIPRGPGKSVYFCGDLTDDEFVRASINETAGMFGRLDYLVNSLGLLLFDQDRSLLDIDLDLWDRVIDVNLKSFVLTTRHAVPLMRDSGGGAIVHFSSCQALRGDIKPQDAYGAAKGAILGAATAKLIVGFGISVEKAGADFHIFVLLLKFGGECLDVVFFPAQPAQLKCRGLGVSYEGSRCLPCESRSRSCQPTFEDHAPVKISGGSNRLALIFFHD